MKVLVTGGAGFIGSNYVRHALEAHPSWELVVLDKLTYAGGPDNLPLDDKRVRLVEADICNADAVLDAARGAELIIHMAAESHVDRSILGGRDAVQTNVVGTFNVLEAARQVEAQRVLHLSTDEVYGAIPQGVFTEESALNPRNPYSASKAGGDRLAYSYFITYGLPVVITRPCNNYGPRQYPEKLVPLFTWRAMQDEPLPVYGNGMQVRDWLHVSDHCRAIDLLLERGEVGEVYNIPAGNEHPNMETIQLILDELGKPDDLIAHVEDRPGHDIRYALSGEKLQALGWRSEVEWEKGMRDTIKWFVAHPEWLATRMARSREYFERWYGNRA